MKWNIHFNKRKLTYFLAMLAFLALTVKFIRPAAETVFHSTVAKAERRLPIYCVDTSEKKIAISFDAAWGAGLERRRKRKKRYELDAYHI